MGFHAVITFIGRLCTEDEIKEKESTTDPKTDDHWYMIYCLPVNHVAMSKYRIGGVWYVVQEYLGYLSIYGNDVEGPLESAVDPPVPADERFKLYMLQAHY